MHDHNFKEEEYLSEEEIKLRHLESDIRQLRKKRAMLRKQFAVASKLGEKVDYKELKVLDNKICYRVKRHRMLRSRLCTSRKESSVRCVCERS